MIPGTIEDWKKALKESKPGPGRGACVCALHVLGVETEAEIQGKWLPVTSYSGMDCNHRVKPTARPWNAEDAKRHVGFAFRVEGDNAVYIIRDAACRMGVGWNDVEYARPIPGTDPATWDWKKCEVVE